MTYLTLGEAEREVGVTKSTISRAIKDGRLSAKRNEHGHYQIDPVELFRVYEPTQRNSQDSDERNTPQQPAQHHATSKNGTDEYEMVPWLFNRLEKTEQELADTEALLKERDRTLEELREAYRTLPSPEQYQAKMDRLEQEQADALAKQKTKYTRVLVDQKTKQAKAVAEERQQKSEQWEAALAERQGEIQEARNEAAALREKRQEELKQSEALRRQLAEIEQRGFIARLFNRKPTTV